MPKHTFADEVIEMTKDMDLRFDRSTEESMLLDIVLKAKIAARLEKQEPQVGSHEVAH